MSEVARVGDTHSHGGTIIEGSPKHFDQGKAVARVGDKATCPIHGEVTIVTQGASQKYFDQGKQLAKVGTSLSCGAVINSGSPVWTDGG